MFQSAEVGVGSAGKTQRWTLGDVAVGGGVRHTLNSSQTPTPAAQNSCTYQVLASEEQQATVAPSIRLSHPER